MDAAYPNASPSERSCAGVVYGLMIARCTGEEEGEASNPLLRAEDEASKQMIVEQLLALDQLLEEEEVVLRLGRAKELTKNE